MTQAELGQAVGVDRNTVSRWENSEMLPSDLVVVASLAKVLNVEVEWLIGGDRVAAANETALMEGAPPVPPPRRYYDPSTGELPARARAIIVGYLDRLRQHECTEAQLAGAEALFLASARNTLSTIPLESRPDSQICADIDAAWDLAVQILRREGIRP